MVSKKANTVFPSSSTPSAPVPPNSSTSPIPSFGQSQHSPPKPIQPPPLSRYDHELPERHSLIACLVCLRAFPLQRLNNEALGFGSRMPKDVLAHKSPKWVQMQNKRYGEKRKGGFVAMGKEVSLLKVRFHSCLFKSWNRIYPPNMFVTASSETTSAFILVRSSASLMP
jgi:hypothetical protein